MNAYLFRSFAKVDLSGKIAHGQGVLGIFSGKLHFLVVAHVSHHFSVCEYVDGKIIAGTAGSYVEFQPKGLAVGFKGEFYAGRGEGVDEKFSVFGVSHVLIGGKAVKVETVLFFRDASSTEGNGLNFR